jgi:hypothetical protein
MVDQNTLNRLFEAALQDQTEYRGWEPVRQVSATGNDNENPNRCSMKPVDQTYRSPKSRMACQSGYTVW